MSVATAFRHGKRKWRKVEREILNGTRLCRSRSPFSLSSASDFLADMTVATDIRTLSSADRTVANTARIKSRALASFYILNFLHAQRSRMPNCRQKKSTSWSRGCITAQIAGSPVPLQLASTSPRFTGGRQCRQDYMRCSSWQLQLARRPLCVCACLSSSKPQSIRARRAKVRSAACLQLVEEGCFFTIESHRPWLRNRNVSLCGVGLMSSAEAKA